MRSFLIILYSGIWIAYIVAAGYMLKEGHGSFIILIMPLLGIGGWLYGAYIGLLLVVFSTIIHFVLMSFMYADNVVYYQNRLIGTIISIAVVLLTGHMRKNINNIKKTNRKLDLLVDERTDQLNRITSQLIDESEERRIKISQILHDGIGQQMTGVQLYSSSLSTKLLELTNPLAAIASLLNKSGNTVHNQIRQIARMLFPIKISHIGLLPALDELASCYTDLERIKFTITENSPPPILPEKTSLELYRISQEMANHCINQLGAKNIHINVSSNAEIIALEFNHDGTALQENIFYESLLLINYRLQMIDGNHQKFPESHLTQSTIFSAPISKVERPCS